MFTRAATALHACATGPAAPAAVTVLTLGILVLELQLQKPIGRLAACKRRCVSSRAAAVCSAWGRCKRNVSFRLSHGRDRGWFSALSWERQGHFGRDSNPGPSAPSSPLEVNAQSISAFYRYDNIPGECYITCYMLGAVAVC